MKRVLVQAGWCLGWVTVTLIILINLGPIGCKKPQASVALAFPCVEPLSVTKIIGTDQSLATVKHDGHKFVVATNSIGSITCIVVHPDDE